MFTSYSQATEALFSKTNLTQDVKLKKWCNNLSKLLAAIEEKEMEFSFLKDEMERLSMLIDGPTQANQIRTLYSDISRKVLKAYGFVTPQYYQNQWMALGMIVFGIPFGIMFGMSMNNMGFVGIGLAIGLPIGIAIGQQKDKQAADEGKVLNI